MRLPSFRNSSFILSLLLGGFFSLSAYGYWLIDILPPTSRRIFFYTILSSIVGVFGYYYLLELWIIPHLGQSQRVEKWKSVIWGAFLGSTLMFAGTSAWASDSIYLTFLLPKQQLEITAMPSEDGHASQASIMWVTTSLGDVSYDTMELNGWERTGDQLVLKDPAHNSIHWQGRTGSDASILFQKSPLSGDVAVSWNGDVEIIDLKGSNDTNFLYKRKLDIPFYASGTGVSFIILINFVLVGIALSILFFKYQQIFDESIAKAIGYFSSHNQWQDVGIILGLLLLAFLLRIFNLENLYPYTDEYNHLIAANEILAGTSLGEVYQRSLATVTLPVVASYRLFGVSLWAARFPGVLFNVLGVIPLYLISRKINRPIALISGILYATSPYLIAFSRNVRGYAVYPFYFYVVLYLMILFLERFPERFSIFKDWKKIRPAQLGVIFFLALVAYYAFFFGVYSTFKIILVVYGIFAIFLLMKFDMRDKWNWLAVAITIPITFFVMGGICSDF